MGSGGGPFGFGGDDDEVPVVPITKYEPAKAQNDFKPINAMQWMDSITGEEFSYIKDLNGNVTISVNDRSGRPNVDDPISVNNINTNLPAVGNLPDFNNRYAAAVVNLTDRMRTLQDTITLMEQTAPELIPQNAPVIEAFKKASKLAMDRNFDIRKNGIDKKLASMGLSNSSTALGAEIALSRERTDSEIMNNLQTAELGQKTKQQSITNLFNIGDSLVKEATVELNRYDSESRNELGARQQDLGRLDLVQKQASEQVRLNLANEELRVNTELNNRRNRLALMQMRNPNQVATQLLLGGNSQAISAVQGDNAAMHNLVTGQLGEQNANTQMFNVNQANQSDPFGEILMTAAGTTLGKFGGQVGTNYADKLFPEQARNRNRNRN